MHNAEVARLLEHIANLLELKGETSFRVGAYREAARRIESLAEDVEKLHATGRLREVPRIGESIAAKIGEYLTTGRCAYLEDLQSSIPAGLIELLSVPGLGPRKVQLLFRELGVTDLAGLEQAAREQRLRQLPGMGEKSEQNILRELERFRQRTKRHLLGIARPLAEEIAALLRQHPAVAQADPAGSVRRWAETVGDVDVLAASERPEEVMAYFTTLPLVREVIAQGATKSSVLTPAGMQVDLRVVEPASYGAALQYFTGSKAHNVRLRELAIRKGFKLNEYGLFAEPGGERLAGELEEELYRLLGLPLLPPELREDRGEISAALAGPLPNLITEDQLRGDLHCHTDWSDGRDTLEQMALAARGRGYEYLAISDHSVGLGVAHGLSVDRLRQQREAIDALNDKLFPFRILASVEVNIRADGSLDYEDDVLASFDVVTASVHSSFNQEREKMTERIRRAIANPYVDIVGHPTGRLIGARDRYAVDVEAILDAAVETDTALELNASPERLDLDDVTCRQAKARGVKVAINADAHAATQLDLRYGVATARRGWLEARDVLNAIPLAELLPWLRRRAPDRGQSR